MKKNTLPVTIQGRLALVGRALYGKAFRSKLAAGLNISRTTLWDWLRPGGKRLDKRDIDGELIDLIECERDAADERSIELATLSKRLREVHSNV